MKFNQAFTRSVLSKDQHERAMMDTQLMQLNRVNARTGFRKPSCVKRDARRKERRLEIRRIWSEAYRDNTDSIGEVVSRSTSTLIKAVVTTVLGEKLTATVEPGDVLRDPKLFTSDGVYKHPAMRM